MNKKRIGILTGGGDVQPLNALIEAAYFEAKKNNINLIGINKGWQGLLEKDFSKFEELNFSSKIGGTILKSSRVNILRIDDGPEKIKKSINELNLSGLIIVGGEDTLSNSFFITDFPQILITKTIDNDVGIVKGGKLLASKFVNFFTLGHPTAAEKIIKIVSVNEGLRTTAYSHERIIIVESMGMQAGWLALSSCLGNPDFIIVPEFPLDYNYFLEKIVERYKKERNVIVVIAEGAKWKNGNFISADENEKDDFGHPKFKGAAEVLSKRLKEDIKKEFNTRNINSVNPSYIYRSGKPNKLDIRTAQKLGKRAIKLFDNGMTSRVFLTTKYRDSRIDTNIYPLDKLKTIENFHRFLDERFYDESEFTATSEAKKYWLKIVEPLDEILYGHK